MRKLPLKQPALLGVLTLAAVVVWGNGLRQVRSAAPARRHVEAAMAATRAGESRRAEREWRAAITLEPRDPALWEQLGELHFSTGNWPAATEAFRELLRLAPKTLGLQSRLAASALRAGDEVAAYRYAREALAREPDDIAALAVGALLFANTGEEKARLDCLRRLVRHSPDDRDFLAMFAESLVEQHLYDEARPIVARLLQVEPSHAAAYAWRAVITIHTGAPSAPVEADLYRSLRLNPLAPFPRLTLGQLYRRQGRLDRALFQLEHASRLAPERLEILYELGETYAAAGEEAKAARTRARFAARRREADRVRLLEQRCAAYPKEASYPRELGLLALRAGDERKAAFFLRRAQALTPGDATVRAGLARVGGGPNPPAPFPDSFAALTGKGEMRRTRATYSPPSLAGKGGGGLGPPQAVNGAPVPNGRPAARHYETGLHRLQAGDGAGATIAWQTAIALEPSFVEPYLALAAQREAAGEFVAAAGVLERLGRANPEALHVACRRADLYLRAGLFAQVVPIGRAAVAREPECAVAHRVQGALRLGAGDPSGAVASLERARQLAAGNASEQSAIAPLLAEAGRPDAAIALVETLLAGRCDPVPANAALARLLVRYRCGDAGERRRARDCLDCVFASEPGHPVANAAMGELLVATGRHSAARPYLDRAGEHGILDPDLLAAVAATRLRLGLPGGREADASARDLRHYRTALQQARKQYLARPDRTATLRLASLEARRGDLGDASYLARSLLRNDPDDGAALALLHGLSARGRPLATGPPE